MYVLRQLCADHDSLISPESVMHMRHIINRVQEEPVQEGEREREIENERQWTRGKLIYYPITLTLVTGRRGSIKLPWPGIS